MIAFVSLFPFITVIMYIIKNDNLMGVCCML
jgi:hypothetical protein